MKSLPETELWKKIKTKLGKYEEEPDDQWDAIVSGINNVREKDSTGLAWALRTLLILLVAYLLIPANISSPPSVPLASDLASIPKEGPFGSKPAVDFIEDGSDFSGSESVNIHEGDPGPLVVEGTANNRTNPSSGRMRRSRHETVDQEQQDILSHAGIGEDVSTREASLYHETSDKTQAVDIALDVNSHVVKINSVEISIGTDPTTVDVSKDTIRVRMSSPDTQKPKRKKRPLQLYVSFTPSLSFYKLTPDQRDQITMKEVKPSGIFSSDRFGISLDAGIHRPFAKNLAWFAGVTYYQQQQTIRYTALTDEVSEVRSHDDNYTVTPGTSLRKVSYSMHNVGASSGLLYTIKSSTLQHQIGAGLQLHYGLSGSSSENAVRNDSQFYLNYQIHYRLSWKASKNVDFYVQPAYTQGLFDQKVNTQPFSVTPSRAGIGFGLVYSVR